MALINQYTGDGTLQDARDTTALVAVGPVQFAPGFVGQAFRLERKSYLWADLMFPRKASRLNTAVA